MTKIYVDHGVEPWKLSSQTRLIEVLDFYNIPLAGIVEQEDVEHTRSFLFVCASGEDSDTNVWLYAPLDEVEVAELQSVVGDDVVQSIARALQNKVLTGAVAQDWRVVMTGDIDAGLENPGVIVQRFLNRQIAKASHTTENMGALLEESKRSSSLISA